MSDLKKYKVVYWNNGNKCVAEVDAYSKYDAKKRFYLKYPCDDIIRVEEVAEK